MRKTLTLSLAAMAALTVTAVQAQTPERGAQRGAEMTRDAAEQRATQMFARLDVNEDGEISAADREARSQSRFDALDADGDGAITQEEFANARESRRAERTERQAARGGERMARGEGRRGPGKMGRRGGMRGARAVLGQADADSNGTVTQAEFMTAMLARFDAADADGDGTVSREERRNARPEGRGGRGGEGRRARSRMIG